MAGLRRPAAQSVWPVPKRPPPALCRRVGVSVFTLRPSRLAKRVSRKPKPSQPLVRPRPPALLPPTASSRTAAPLRRPHTSAFWTPPPAKGPKPGPAKRQQPPLPATPPPPRPPAPPPATASERFGPVPIARRLAYRRQLDHEHGRGWGRLHAAVRDGRLRGVGRLGRALIRVARGVSDRQGIVELELLRV